MTEMSKAQIGRFLIQDTLTGKLATVKKDGSSHVVPIWFVLDKSFQKQSALHRLQNHLTFMYPIHM
jgi:nitroimidazol reductase NimA-like FMN-containing flavoprotein (pyridoxamine 5'-phosphate oxidase superfamily)